MSEAVRAVAKRIKDLEIQGARNIALAAISALVEEADRSRAETRDEFLQEMLEAKDILFNTRETEPLMRNSLRKILFEVRESPYRDPKELARLISSSSKEFLEDLQMSHDRITEYGSKRIHSSQKIFTHCHSSTVTGILKRAKDEGKNFEVLCTESRPFFQGRITCRELLEQGIRTTMIVDAAARYFMKTVDFVLVGADAITSEGNILNKIGTSMVALAAYEARIPFYVASELLKFSPQTIYGEYEKIEERNRSEVWEDAPSGLNIRNPAFDITRRDYVSGIICEEGIISPHSIMEVVRRRYPWILAVS
jgi:ribose 1,5-bisphosphate isomerase